VYENALKSQNDSSKAKKDSKKSKESTRMRTKEDEVAEKAGWMNEEQLGGMMKQIGVGIVRVGAKQR
jgi:hypothetical protein